MNAVIKHYKVQNGAVNYPEVLKIPTGDRILGLVAAGGYQRIHIMLSAAIQVALESLNLSRSLSPTQIIDLSDALIDSATEDNLSVEDVILFLQKLVRGEAGKLYNTLDIPKFLEAFEDYRQARHETMIRIREEQEAQFKISGRTDRKPDFSKREDIDPLAFNDLLKTKYENQQGDSHMAGGNAGQAV